MGTSTSKLTRKYQATIPEPVRAILGVAAGDTIAFDVVGQEVRLRKARPVDLAFAHALEGTLTEWTSSADEEAYLCDCLDHARNLEPGTWGHTFTSQSLALTTT